MRIYDPRIGRFLSTDPLHKSYPELTPYQFASNTPIQAIDLDGLEKYIIHYKIVNGNDVILKVVTDNSLKYLSSGNVWSIPTFKPKVVQYIKEDEKGKTLSITGEIPLKNFGSTIYVGPWNPKDKNGNDIYKYPAINSLDAAAKKHDKAYDEVNAIGAKGAIVDLTTLSADKQLIRDASTVVAMYTLGIKDPVNKQYVSEETKDAAIKVIGIFVTTVVEKEARLGAIKTGNKISETWDKVKSYINEGLKEAERRLTPTSY